MSKTALIADDSMFMRAWLGRILVQNGYQVIADAANGNEAVEKYQLYFPDVVLLDITMPGTNGLIALQKIKKMNPSAIVIMCSALGQKHLIMEALRYGAKDFIIKPYFDNLIPVLQNLK
ncbi:response regulator [Priestia abyssalis]|uniref:response regulator n=1 Tax=Priestia abyssalis TaxID=1221450 RepID=UPI000995CC90|nr:response regulator [Priestia abyssalis]